MAVELQWSDERLTHWTVQAFVAGLGQVLESLRLDGDAEPLAFNAVIPSAEEELGWTAALWREARGDLAPGSVLGVGCSVETLQMLAQIVLGAAPSTPDEARETYSELVNQSLGVLAAEAGNRLGRTIQMGSAEPGERPSDAVAPVLIQFQAEGRDYGIMLAPNAAWVQAVLSDGTLPKPASDHAADPPLDPPSTSLSDLGSTDPADSSDRQRDPKLLRNLDRLMDIDMDVAISFGETSLLLADVLKLSSGAIVELNRAVSDSVQLLVNDTVIAEGEVVVVEGNYGIRITNVVSPQERIRFLL